MKVVVDTSVWSTYLRRPDPPESLARVLERFIRRDQVHLLGIVRQELLSGVPQPQQFDRLSRALSDLPDELATSDDHSLAAKFYNLCRVNGIQGSSIDFLICAIAKRLQAPILTLDRDFFAYARYLPIRVLSPDTR
jgi:predicted nucleic acid-binding protein